MKTYANWQGTFNEYFEPGDEVDEATYWYFLECVPPAVLASSGFLVGEPSTQNSEGKLLFSAFTEKEGKYFYNGEMTVEQFRALLQGKPIWDNETEHTRA